MRCAPRPGRKSQTLVNLFRYFGGVAGEFKGTVLPAGDDQLQYTRREPLGVVAGDPAVELAADDRRDEDRRPSLAAGNTADAEDRAGRPADHPEDGRDRLASSCPPGCSTWSPATDRRSARRCWSSIRTSTRCRSPDRPRSGDHVARGRRRTGWPTSPWSWAARARTSSSRTRPTPDNIDATAAGVLTAMRFTRQGQSCTAGSRLFVHADVYDDFLAVLVEKVQGPARSAIRSTRPPTWARSSTRSSSTRSWATSRTGSPSRASRFRWTAPTWSPEGLDGFYQGPTIFAGVDNSWRIAQEEIFGPVLVAIPWRDRDEVIAMANDSHYGLGAYIWSQRPDRRAGHRAPDRVRLGPGQPGRRPGRSASPTAATRTSGIGREFSIEGAMESFTQIKQINVKLS